MWAGEGLNPVWSNDLTFDFSSHWPFKEEPIRKQLCVWRGTKQSTSFFGGRWEGEKEQLRLRQISQMNMVSVNLVKFRQKTLCGQVRDITGDALSSHFPKWESTICSNILKVMQTALIRSGLHTSRHDKTLISDELADKKRLFMDVAEAGVWWYHITSIAAICDQNTWPR